MSEPSRSAQFQVGVDLLGTTVDPTTGTVLAQTGDASNGQADTDNVELFGSYGTVFRPSTPSGNGKACQAFTLRRGDHDIAIGYRDERGQLLAGSLQPGERCDYAPGTDGANQTRVLFKADGSWVVYGTKGNAPGAGGMMVQVDPANDTIRILNSAGNGIIISPDGVLITTTGGASAVELLASGDCSMIGKGAVQVDGSSGCLGSIAVVGLNSALTGVTGIAGKASLKWVIE